MYKITGDYEHVAKFGEFIQTLPELNTNTTIHIILDSVENVSTKDLSQCSAFLDTSSVNFERSLAKLKELIHALHKES